MEPSIDSREGQTETKKIDDIGFKELIERLHGMDRRKSGPRTPSDPKDADLVVATVAITSDYYFG